MTSSEEYLFHQQPQNDANVGLIVHEPEMQLCKKEAAE